MYLSEGSNKSNNSKESTVCHHCFFNQGFKFQDFVCRVCHDLTMLSLTISDIAIITVKGVDYCCIIHDLSKSGANNLLKSLCLIIVDVYKICFKEIKIKNLVYSYFFDNLIKAKNIENKNI